MTYRDGQAELTRAAGLVTHWHSFTCAKTMMMIMMMMKLPILPCAEKLELVLSTAPKTSDNTDKDSSIT